MCEQSASTMHKISCQAGLVGTNCFRIRINYTSLRTKERLFYLKRKKPWKNKTWKINSSVSITFYSHFNNLNIIKCLDVENFLCNSHCAIQKLLPAKELYL
ncbi:hypothetical protein ILYODFUR_018201 [Ilyodon furcidens]|uniref:Uncharacterized protein n=1 Tax=Ilyodon furcidens TaxID=33524 RepID=A0ABV0U7G0_9TELE